MNDCASMLRHLIRIVVVAIVRSMAAAAISRFFRALARRACSRTRNAAGAASMRRPLVCHL